MAINVGTMDRMLRIAIGLALLALVFLVSGPGRWWGLLGIIPLATAFTGWCPAYSVMGINTCGSKHA